MQVIILKLVPIFQQGQHMFKNSMFLKCERFNVNYSSVIRESIVKNVI